MSAFIDENRARKTRPLSARAVRDDHLLFEIRRVHAESNGVYGQLKVWDELRDQGVEIARCTVERLIREHGIEGCHNAKTKRTAVPGRDPVAADDLVRCDFSATRPGEGYQLEYGPLVFSEEDGEPWWPSRFEWVWQEFRKSSRLAPRFHDLRHTALSLMLRQGNSPKVVQEIAGHHSSAYTMDTYCWSDRRTQRAAADSIGDLFSGALGAVERQSGTKSGNNSEAVPPLNCENVVPPREFES